VGVDRVNDQVGPVLLQYRDDLPDVAGPPGLVVRRDLHGLVFIASGQRGLHRHAVVDGDDGVRLAVAFGVEEIAQQAFEQVQSIEEGKVHLRSQNLPGAFGRKERVAGLPEQMAAWLVLGDVHRQIEGRIDGYRGA